MSRGRKTNHIKRRPKPGRSTRPRHQHPSVVLTIIDDFGQLIDIDISNEPELADLVNELTRDCPYCDHQRGDRT